jgi:hypothetical protein
MRPIVRVAVVATGTVLFIAAGRNPEPPPTRGETPDAVTVVRIERVPTTGATTTTATTEGATTDRP